MSSYPVAMRDAAFRHHRCADRLMQADEFDEAGYLFGLAAECAIKAMSEVLSCLRRSDLQYAHFPELRNHVLDYAEGRRATELSRLMANGRCLAGWHVSIRCSRKKAVTSKTVKIWRDDTVAALNLMEST
ncbi:MAG: hypothetical protein IV100_09360 [Myxococcales bacterium]|nr:hypothetical protein [Myxococcales bacterium]